MSLRHAWIIAKKDLKSIIRRKVVLYTTVALPLIIGVVLPVIIEFGGRRSGGFPAAALPQFLGAFAFLFVIIPAIIPTPIASYSIVGEKVEKSLEPLLATPVADGDILLGKSIAAFLPAMLATFVGATVFMTLMDLVTADKLGYLYFPNWSMGVILLILAPLAALLSIEVSVLASSRVNDVRAASQLGGLVFIPFIGIYVASEIGIITLDTNALLTIAAVMAILDVVLLFISKATFQREQILTRWK